MKFKGLLNKKNIKLSNCLLGLLIICIFVTELINILHPNYKDKLPQPSYGKPVLIETYLNFNNKPISQIVDDGTYMYVLADSHNGYVQVYDLNGQYQKTISLQRQSISGAFSIACQDGILYIRDDNHNFYTFEHGDYLEFVEDENISGRLKHILFDGNSNHFKVRFGSIWRMDTPTPICVVKRPFYSFIYQYSLDTVLIVLGVILLLITNRKDSKKSVEDGKVPY